MRRRGLPEEIVRAVVESPEQEMEVRPGRMVLQSRVEMGQPPQTYLLRAFVDVDRQPAELVTAYRTSRIAKYWRSQP